MLRSVSTWHKYTVILQLIIGVNSYILQNIILNLQVI